MRTHDRYSGLIEKAAPGTHAAAWKLIQGIPLSPKSELLDIAAGNGAFAKRLIDAGFDHVSVSELTQRSFPFETQDIFPWDLNTPFSQSTHRRYHLMTAIEIIEHLDSPLDFLKEIHTLLHEDGYLLLTTPNVQNIVSRLKFLFTGELKSFGVQDFIDQRHLHGMTDHQLKIFFDIVGFSVVKQTSAGSFYSPFKKAIIRPLYWFSRILKGHLEEGDVNIYLMKKTQAKSHLKDSASHYHAVATETVR